MVTDRAERVCRPTRGPASIRASAWVVASLLVALLIGLSACSSEEPEITLSALGAAVGDAKMDEADFPALLTSYTSESYRAGTQPDQANYQLYLTAKAAALGLNTPGPGDVQVERDVSGRTATIAFIFEAEQGLFAVADVGRIDVSLVRADSQPHEWLIERIVLAR
ncbi:MAG: hypothetical protein ACYC33_11120 [Thermoleophilia bacterium]